MTDPAVPMPDAQTFLLPARAYLLSMRDQNLPLRRVALDDALTAYHDTPQTTEHERQIARIALVVTPPLTVPELAAIDEAHQATAKLVAKHLVNLAEEWRKYRPFANAYKHGLLVANPEDVTLLDDAGAEVDGIVVWQRRRTGAEGYGHISPPFDEMADYLAAAA